jgi:hypothetical protein
MKKPAERLDDYLQSEAINDRIVQRALREIDTEDLIAMMIGLSEAAQQVIYRNLSKRAHKLLKEDVEKWDSDTPKEINGRAQRFFLQKLKKHVKYFGVDSPGRKKALPPVDLSSEEAIVKTFVALVNHCRYSGEFLALEGIEEKVDHPVMKKGLSLVIDGWEPLLMQSVLEKLKDTYLKQVENRLNMMIEGIDSLASGDIAFVTRERLNAYRGDLV